MGERDHSITCEVCGYQRGGLNDYECDCGRRDDVGDGGISETGGMNDLVCACYSKPRRDYKLLDRDARARRVKRWPDA